MAQETVKYVFEADTGKFAKEVNGARNSVTDFEKTTDNSLTNVGNSFKGVGDSISGVGTKFLPLSIAVGAFFTKGVLGASDLQESLNKTKVAFGDNADAIIKLSEDSSIKFGETQAAVLDTASIFGLLGVEADKVPSIIQRISDVGSLQNRTFEEVSRDFISGFNGSTEAVEKYGIKLKEVDLAQYLVENGTAANTKEAGKLLNAMDSTTKQMLIYEKILNDTNVAQGDFTNTSDGVANGFKIVKAQLSETATQFGTLLLPYVQQFLGQLREWLTALQGLSPQQQDLIVKIGLFALALAPTLIILGKLISGIGSLISFVGFASSAITSIIGLFGTITSALGITSGAIAALGATLSALLLPIALVVGAIVGLYLNFESFRNLVDIIIKVLIDAFNELAGSIIDIFNSDIKPAIDNLFQSFKGLVDSVVQIWNMLIAAIRPLVDLLAGFLSIVIPAAIDILVNYWKVFIAIFGNLFGTVINNIANYVQFLVDVFNGIVTFLKGVFSGDLNLALEGLKQIFIAPFNFIKETIQNIFNGILDSAKAMVGGIGDVVSGIADTVSGVLGFLNPFDYHASFTGSNGTPQFGTSNTYSTTFNVQQTGQLDQSSILRLKGRVI